MPNAGEGGAANVPQEWRTNLVRLKADPQYWGAFAYKTGGGLNAFGQWAKSQGLLPSWAKNVDSRPPNGHGGNAGADNPAGNPGAAPAGHSGGQGGNSGGGNGGGEVGQIVAFFRGKGLGDAAIAGILGNMKVESGFDPRAHNDREGAIGLAQWEGGRRAGLQQYAQAHGGSETDLNIQLGYYWQELSGPYSGVLQQLRNASNAGEAAAIVDGQYEISSGSTRSQRIGFAQQYAADGFQGIHADAGGSAGDYTGDGGGGGTPGRQDYKQGLGELGVLINSVPALKNLLNQAMAHDWTVAHFENQVEDSHWYRSHSSSARSVLAQQVSDPASYQETLNQTIDSVKTLAGQTGFDLDPGQAKNIARAAMLQGQAGNQQWLTEQLGRRQDYSDLQNPDKLTGDMAATIDQLQQLASQYGFKYQDPTRLANNARNVVDGSTTIDTYRQQWLSAAKSMFPGLSDQLDSGQTVQDIADPYVQTMSNLLEIDPSQLSARTRLIRQALQGTQPVKDGNSTKPVVTPLWQFEDQVRNDPRWQYTSNARDAAATQLMQLGQEWGFAV